MRILPYMTLITISVAGGVLVSSQWQVRVTRVVNPVQPYTSLTTTRDALSEEQLRLKHEITAATTSVEQRKATLSVSSREIDRNLASSSAKASTAAGFTKVAGPGVIAVLDDSFDGTLSEQAIAHAADLRDMISLLRAIGAEAISLNGERIITTTAIDCIVNTVLVNDTRLSNPYEIRAIGDAETLARALNDPAVLSDLHNRVTQNGVQFSVTTSTQVEIAAYAGRLPGDHITLVR